MEKTIVRPHCPKCGTQRSPGAHFCTKCGTGLAPTTEEPATKYFGLRDRTGRSRSSKVVRLLAYLLFVLVLGVVFGAYQTGALGEAWKLATQSSTTNLSNTEGTVASAAQNTTPKAQERPTTTPQEASASQSTPAKAPAAPTNTPQKSTAATNTTPSNQSPFNPKYSWQTTYNGNVLSGIEVYTDMDAFNTDSARVIAAQLRDKNNKPILYIRYFNANRQPIGGAFVFHDREAVMRYDGAPEVWDEYNGILAVPDTTKKDPKEFDSEIVATRETDAGCPANAVGGCGPTRELGEAIASCVPPALPLAQLPTDLSKDC